MNVKYHSGHYDIYECGSVIGLRDQPIEMIMQTKSGGSQTYRFIFETDRENPHERTSFKRKNKNEMEVYLYNFNHALDCDDHGPMPLGTLDDRTLYLSYRIDSFSKRGDKLFHYTWFLGEENK